MKKYRIKVEGRVFEVEVEEVETGTEENMVSAPKSSSTRPRERQSAPSPALERKPQQDSQEGVVSAPMAGTVVSIAVQLEQQVSRGDLLLILEAMKMENEIDAPCGGVVKEIRVDKDQRVESGEILIRIE